MDIADVLYVYVDQGRKFPVTTLLRALGCASDEEVLRLFNLIEDVSVSDSKISQFFGRKVFFSQDEIGVVDEKTGEVILERDTIFEDSHLPRILKQHEA
jgi:DNA-directed RNA polymerase subunit beta